MAKPAGESKGGGGGGGGGNLMNSYYLYSALLALKLISSIPLSTLVCNPEKLMRANISDLKHLSPFWLVSGLYMTTSPDYTTAVTLLRVFVAARLITLLSYLYPDVPRVATELAFYVSFVVTAYMGGAVVYHYKDSF